MLWCSSVQWLSWISEGGQGVGWGGGVALQLQLGFDHSVSYSLRMKSGSFGFAGDVSVTDLFFVVIFSVKSCRPNPLTSRRGGANQSGHQDMDVPQGGSSPAVRALRSLKHARYDTMTRNGSFLGYDK